MNAGQSADITCSVSGTTSIDALIHVSCIKKKEKKTSENEESGRAELIKGDLNEDDIKNLKVDGAFVWDSIFEDEFLNKAQADQIRQALMASVAVVSLPEETFLDYVDRMAMGHFLKLKTKSILGTVDLNMKLKFRVDTKKYGQLLIEFSYDGMSFFMSGTNYGSFGGIDYKIVGGDRIKEIPKSKREGLAGMFTQYDFKKFADATKKVALSEFRSATGYSESGIIKRIVDTATFNKIAFSDTVCLSSKKYTKR